MRATRFLGAFALAGSAVGNLESPGLESCVRVTHDQAVLTQCDGEVNQLVSVDNGQLRFSLPEGDFCLKAISQEPNALVVPEKCQEDANAVWELSENGNIILEGTDLCLDVKAEKKDNGEFETFEELYKRDLIPLQVYTCHELCTQRVNQLWTLKMSAGQTTTQEENLHAYGGHFVSPGLEKCWSILPAVGASIFSVTIVTCSVSDMQKFHMANNAIMSKNFCLTAIEAAANADVDFEECKCDYGHSECDAEGQELQDWFFTSNGNIKLSGTELCLDIKAEENADGSFENWEEIKAHPANQLHLYTCHDADTERVNQLWEWSPIGADELHTIQSGERPDCQDFPEIPTGPIIPEGPVEPSHHQHGSMPEDEDEADALAVDGLLNNYQVKGPGMGAFAGLLATVGAAALSFLVVGLYKWRSLRPDLQAESQLLETIE